MSENPSALSNRRFQSLERMLAAWNETDLDKIRGHLEFALTEDVDFCDPQHHISGYDAFEVMVRDLRASVADLRCARASELDAHHNRVRYSWTVCDGDTLLVPGFDVVTFAADDRVARIDGFFGPLVDLQPS